MTARQYRQTHADTPQWFRDQCPYLSGAKTVPGRLEGLLRWFVKVVRH
jgi:hypothetical protein